MSRRVWIIASSVAVHSAAAFALFANGVWKIDQLEAGRADVSLAVPMAMPPPPAAAAAASNAHVPVNRPKHVATVLTQRPVIARIEPQKAGSVGTNPNGTGTGDGETTNGCTVEPCGPIGTAPPIEIPQVELPKVEIPKPPPILPPNKLAEMRISGNTQIGAPGEVKKAMQRDNKAQLIANLKVCVGTDGSVSSAAMLKTTGYPAYDAKLVDGVRTWRYRPYMVGTTAIASCGTVQFVYSMQ